MRKIGIIGAGITGLSLAWYLQKFYQNCSVTLFEKGKKSGGMIDTLHDPLFFEKGPRTFSTKRCPDLLSLIDDVGLSHDLIFSSKKALARWVYENGRLQKPVPFSLGLKALFADVFRKPFYYTEDVSVDTFFSHRFGRDFTERCIDPMVAGIYAAEKRDLSLEMAFPTLWDLQKKHHSLAIGMWKSSTKGPPGLFTLRKGLQQLVQRLSENVAIIYEANPSIKSAHVENKGDKYTFDHIFVTCAPDDLFPEGPCLEVSYNPLTTVNCGYFSQTFSKNGFGYLIPSREKEPILGCVFDSMIFPEQNQTEQELRLTLMMGGAHQPTSILKSDEEILTITYQVLAQHLQLKKPDFIRISHYKKAIAQYPVGFSEKKTKWLQNMKKEYPHVDFVGTHLGSPAVNGRVKVAQEAALTIALG